MPFQKATIFPCMFHFRGPCRGNSVGPAGNLHGFLLWFWNTSFYVGMSVCRFAQFLRGNEHTYRHPDKQTYNSPIRFLHHLETRIPCMFANAGHGNIQPTWKIDVFSENKKSHFHGQGHVFRRKHKQTSKKQDLQKKLYVCLAMQGEEIWPKLLNKHFVCRFKERRFWNVCFVFHKYTVFTVVFVGLTSFYEKTNIHTYIHTNKLTTRQVGFCTTSKLEFHVCLPMQAVEIYNQHGKSTFFLKSRNFKFHGQGHVFRRKREKHIKQVNESFYVCMSVCMYVWPCRARKYDQNGPYIHTYMDQCRFKKGRFFHVCLLLPMQADGKRILGVPHFEMANGVYGCMYVCMYVCMPVDSFWPFLAPRSECNLKLPQEVHFEHFKHQAQNVAKMISGRLLLGLFDLGPRM